VTADDQLIDLHESLAVAPAQLARALASVVKAALQALKGASFPPASKNVGPVEASKKIAQSLVDGEKRAVFLGNVATQSADATQAACAGP
jgi:NADH-quinone oxidoreductase subunit G